MTTPPSPAPPRRGTGHAPNSASGSTIGTLRIAVRVAAVAAWLALCIGPSLLSRALHRAHNPWPRRFLGGTAWLMGIEVRSHGEKAPGRVLILANHVSWIDILALAGTTGAAFVGHDGLATTPLLRGLCRQNDTVFIARHDRTSVGAQVDQLRVALAEMGAVALFPEGTTSDGITLLPFKSSLLGALDPLSEGVTVQPVLLDYGPGVAGIAWIDQEPGLANFRRILALPSLEVTVRFLPPLTGAALADRKTITAAARAAINAAMAG